MTTDILVVRSLERPTSCEPLSVARPPAPLALRKWPPDTRPPLCSPIPSPHNTRRHRSRTPSNQLGLKQKGPRRRCSRRRAREVGLAGRLSHARLAAGQLAAALHVPAPALALGSFALAGALAHLIGARDDRNTGRERRQRRRRRGLRGAR